MVVPRCCNSDFLTILQSRAFLRATCAGLCSGTLACVLRRLDDKHDFLEEFNPDPIVFSVFITFASLVATFRTGHALVRFTEAAAMMHKLAACWFDAASTLVAFCRPTYDTKTDDVVHFQETLFRLISVLNALIFNDLQHSREVEHPDINDNFHVFKVLGWEDLADEVQNGVANAKCKVEYTFQCVQQLVVDSMEKKVLAVPPPILTRSFQELGAGMLIYHEARKLSREPLPQAYRLLTLFILIAEAVWSPFMLAMFTNSGVGSFWSAAGGTFLLWFLNGVAESLDNPFKKESSTLNTAAVQMGLNEELKDLRRYARQPTPCLRPQWKDPQVTKAVSTMPVKNVPSMHARTSSFSVRSSRNHLEWLDAEEGFEEDFGGEPKRYGLEKSGAEQRASRLAEQLAEEQLDDFQFQLPRRASTETTQDPADGEHEVRFQLSDSGYHDSYPISDSDHHDQLASSQTLEPAPDEGGTGQCSSEARNTGGSSPATLCETVAPACGQEVLSDVRITPRTHANIPVVREVV